MSLAGHFERIFGAPPAGIWSAPGRVNLIGEHTDYNDGFVLPFALDRSAQVAVRLHHDGLVRCASRQQGAEVVVTNLGDLAPTSTNGWPAYVLGVAWALIEEGSAIRGFDLLLDSDVPIGAGLSSSAAVETATAIALRDLLHLELDCMALAMVCHRAETEFVGAPVGVMDQVVSACALEGSALLLDCRSLETTQVPFDPARLGCTLLVIDTGAAHANTDGAYADRRASCERSADELGLSALRDATLEQVAETPRARHVVSECARVLATVDALMAGDIAEVGALMLASHASLRDDFEVSSHELDTAVDAAMSAGAVGARLTGAGFGGSAIALVPQLRVDAVTTAVRDAFAVHRFAAPEIFAVSAGSGASRVDLPA